MIETLALASPFAWRIWQNENEGVQAFLAQYALDDIIQRDTMNAIIYQFISDNKCHNNHLNHDDFDNLNLNELDETFIMARLRSLRRLMMVRFIWQEALGLVDFESFVGQLSDFADSMINFAKDFVYAKLSLRYGEPKFLLGKIPKKDELAIIAMGKLGARELNLSSDIDLIFLHREMGETDISKLGKKSIDNQKFMTQLGRGIIRLLDETTADGFVFRVDMRLRPWGEGSPLVITLPALQKYFAKHGRTWERFAWLKMRVVNQIDAQFLAQITTTARNFVFRYYVDYSTFSALREMRMLIANQVAQREDINNIKLGVGGIRDIEFIAQAFALIYGGNDNRFMTCISCLSALHLLFELQILDKKTYDDLVMAYRFLRRLEHAIQARHDTQTQRLPEGEALIGIAKTLGFDEIQLFLDCLNFHRQNVSLPFDRLVTDRQNLPDNQTIAFDTQQDLHQLKTAISQATYQPLDDFFASKLVASLSEEAKNRLQTAYPVIIHALLAFARQSSDISVVIPRLVSLLESICRRSIYLVMLSENPKATLNLIPMLSISPWIAKELATYPVLLDTLLQKRYQHLPDKTELSKILAQNLLSVADFDDESFLMAIRLFKKNQVLAVAESDVLSQHPIMKVSDSLTFISEVVLKACLQRAFLELSDKHGYPIGLGGEVIDLVNMGIAIIGYGKLGGIEMSYASDLDVVFLHRLDEQAMTTGGSEKQISGMKFATRLVQKLIGYLTTQTRDGRAYELDMRLRPSGNAGVMVVSVHGFANYQTDKAWVWEHQALVRARGICGDEQVLLAFERIRRRILTQQRDFSNLKQAILSMREKMKEHLSQRYAHQFHLKQDAGGLVDIEFMAQFAVLYYAHQYPNLTTWSDNVRIFEAMAQVGIWEDNFCTMLTQAYLNIRKATHLQALSEQDNVVDNQDWQAIRQQVINAWQFVFSPET